MSKCIVAECCRVAKARGYCNLHYQRIINTGCSSRPDKIRHERCTVGGCNMLPRSLYSPYCEMHYGRLRRNGTLLNVRKPPSPKLEHSHGYITVPHNGHPVSTGKVHKREYQHRIVYYDEHGAGPFHCHWCNKAVTWDDLHVDHLNDDKQDNRPENLVASCPICNQKRGHHKMIARMRELKAIWIEFRGERKTLKEWSDHLGISRSALRTRLTRWPLERALTEPRGRFGPQHK